MSFVDSQAGFAGGAGGYGKQDYGKSYFGYWIT